MEIVSFTLDIPKFRLLPDHDAEIRQATNSLDSLSTPRFWRNRSAPFMLYAAPRLTYLTSCLTSMPSTSSRQALVELSFYNTAFLCRYLPRGSQDLLLGFFEQQQQHMCGYLEEIATEQSTERYASRNLTTICALSDVILTMGRLANVIFDASHAMSKRRAFKVAQCGVLSALIAGFARSPLLT